MHVGDEDRINIMDRTPICCAYLRIFDDFEYLSTITMHPLFNLIAYVLAIALGQMGFAIM
jgi:hypothetical protein